MSVLSFFGIHVSRQTRHPVHLTKIFFLWILGGVVLMMLGSVGVYQYSTHPQRRSANTSGTSSRRPLRW